MSNTRKTHEARTFAWNGLCSLRVLVASFAVASLSSGPRAMTCAFVPSSAANALARIQVAKTILNHRGYLATGNTKVLMPGRCASTTALPLHHLWKQFLQKTRLLQGEAPFATATSTFDITWIVTEFQDLSHLEELKRFQRKDQNLGLHHHDDETDSEYAVQAREAEKVLLQQAKESADQLKQEIQLAQQHTVVIPHFFAVSTERQTELEADIALLRAKQTSLLQNNANAEVRLDCYQAASQRLQQLAAASREYPLHVVSALAVGAPIAVFDDVVAPVEADEFTPAFAASILATIAMLVVTCNSLVAYSTDPTILPWSLSIDSAAVDSLVQTLQLSQQNLLSEALSLAASIGDISNNFVLFIVETMTRVEAALNAFLDQLGQGYSAASSSFDRLVTESAVLYEAATNTFMENAKQSIIDTSHQIQAVFDSAKQQQATMTEGGKQTLTVLTERLHQAQMILDENVMEANAALTDNVVQAKRMLSESAVEAQTMMASSSKHAQELADESLAQLQIILLDNLNEAQTMLLESVDQMKTELFSMANLMATSAEDLSSQIETIGKATFEEALAQAAAVRLSTIEAVDTALVQDYARDLLERAQQALMLIPVGKGGLSTWSSSLNVAILDQVAQAQQTFAASMSQWMVLPPTPSIGTANFDLDGWKSTIHGLTNPTTALLHDVDPTTTAGQASHFKTDGFVDLLS